MGQVEILWSTVGLLLFIFGAQRPPLVSVFVGGVFLTILICARRGVRIPQFQKRGFTWRFMAESAESVPVHVMYR